MIRGIIFDCFGVVITDALEALCVSLRQTDPDAAEQVRYLVRTANRGLLDPTEASMEIATIFGLDYETYRSQLSGAETKNRELLSHIAELRSTYKVGMLSNIGAGRLTPRFDPGELDRYFDVVIESGAIMHAKPEPEAYEITAERLGVTPSECVFIDDRIGYCEGAEQTGMKAILYTNFIQFKIDLEHILQG